MEDGSTSKSKVLFDEDKRRRYNLFIQVGNNLLYSKAFLELSGNATKLYLWSLMKRRLWKKADMKARKRCGLPEPEQPPFSFTIREAECFGLHRRRVPDAIKELVAVGFIDIVRKGGAEKGNFSLYAWSERWKQYGTDKFTEITYPTNNRHLPRGKDGQWQSLTPMADIRNRDKTVPYEVAKKAKSRDRIVPA